MTETNMDNAAALRQALKDRLPPLLEELRAQKGSPFIRVERAADGALNIAVERARDDTPTIRGARAAQELEASGYRQATGSVVADMVEHSADALVEATARDLELALAELVPAEFHAVTLRDAELVRWWPWSEQTDAGAWLYARTSGPWLTAWPDMVTPLEVAEWMQPALKRHGHPLAADGPDDITPKEWQAEEAAIQERINAGATPQEVKQLRGQQEEWVMHWTDRAEASLVKSARGFTYPHNGVTVAPRLPAPVLRHPDTGQHWAWWPHAMARLYLANPVTAATWCMRSLDKLVADRAALSGVARDALDDVPVPEHTEAMVGALADALRARLPELSKRLDAGAVLACLTSRERHTAMPWDEVEAEFLASIGDNGASTAKELRAMAGDRWRNAQDTFRRWEPQPPHAAPRSAKMLAKVLWLDVVAPQLDRGGRWLAPALAAQVYDRITEATTRNIDVGSNGALVGRDGHQMLLTIDSRVLAPGMSGNNLDRQRLADMGEDGRLLAHGLSLVGSYNAHRLVRFVPRACLQAKVRDPNVDFRVLRFESYADMAHQAGMKGGKRLAEDVRALAYVYDAFRVTLDDGSNDRLWTRGEYMVKTAGRPRRAVTLTVSPLLLPHVQEHYMDDSRWLIPLVDVPPVVGLEHAGQQASLQLLVVRHMRSHAAELVERGGVTINDNVWAAMAARAGVPASLLPRVLERWLVDGDDGHAFLAVEAGRYTLAPVYSEALEFLRRGGQRTIAGRHGAAVTKAIKAKRLGGRKTKSAGKSGG